MMAVYDSLGRVSYGGGRCPPEGPLSILQTAYYYSTMLHQVYRTFNLTEIRLKFNIQRIEMRSINSRVYAIV